MSLYAIMFGFNGTDPTEPALKKEVAPPGMDVIYWKMDDPQYYKWRSRKERWRPLDCRPEYKVDDDSVVFVFRDTSEESAVTHCGAAIHFQQAIAPFDDEVSAQISMAGTMPYAFETRNEQWQTFALAWSVGLLPGEVVGYGFESKGKYDFTVSLLTFSNILPPTQHRYWQDPEMDIGN